MKKILYVFAGLLVATAAGVAAEAKPGYGISSWAGWKPGQISRAECPELRSVPLILKWDSLESAPGQYAFDAETQMNPDSEAEICRTRQVNASGSASLWYPCPSVFIRG